VSRRSITLAAGLAAGLVALFLSSPPGYAAPAGSGSAVAAATCTQQSFLEGTLYSAVQVAQLAQQAGFSGTTGSSRSRWRRRRAPAGATPA
jgi:hypothetical protein